MIDKKNGKHLFTLCIVQNAPAAALTSWFLFLLCAAVSVSPQLFHTINLTQTVAHQLHKQVKYLDEVQDPIRAFFLEDIVPFRSAWLKRRGCWFVGIELVSGSNTQIIQKVQLNNTRSRKHCKYNMINKVSFEINLTHIIYKKNILIIILSYILFRFPCCPVNTKKKFNSLSCLCAGL